VEEVAHTLGGTLEEVEYYDLCSRVGEYFPPLKFVSEIAAWYGDGTGVAHLTDAEVRRHALACLRMECQVFMWTDDNKENVNNRKGPTATFVCTCCEARMHTQYEAIKGQTPHGHLDLPGVGLRHMENLTVDDYLAASRPTTPYHPDQVWATLKAQWLAHIRHQKHRVLYSRRAVHFINHMGKVLHNACRFYTKSAAFSLPTWMPGFCLPRST